MLAGYARATAAPECQGGTKQQTKLRVSSVIRYRLTNLEGKLCCPGRQGEPEPHLWLPVVQKLLLGSSPRSPRGEALPRWGRLQRWSPSPHPALCSGLSPPPGRGYPQCRVPHGVHRHLAPRLPNSPELGPRSQGPHFGDAVLLQQWLRLLLTQPEQLDLAIINLAN